MLLAASLLLLIVAGYHSIAGERRVIKPLLCLTNLPRLGGSRGYSRIVIRAAWHITSLTWAGLAILLAIMHFEASQRSPATLWVLSGIFAVTGLAILTLGRGRHPAWLAFLPIAVLTALAAG